MIPNNHVAITSVMGPYDCHNSSNSNSNIFPEVICISKLIGDKQYLVNRQQRKSIDDYFRRVENTLDIFKAIERVINDLSAFHIQICYKLHEGGRKE